MPPFKESRVNAVIAFSDKNFVDQRKRWGSARGADLRDAVESEVAIGD